MAYLILTDRQGEFDRRELSRPVVIGRAMDCDVCVRDILLSRKHCRIELMDNCWVISDLGSKNGTRVGNDVVSRQILNNGDVIRIGKIQVCFRAGAFIPPPKGQQRHPDVRPIDPKEALSGTVLGFQLFDMEEDSRVSGFPIPKPKPALFGKVRGNGASSTATQVAATSPDARPSHATRPPVRITLKPPPKPLVRSVNAPTVDAKPAEPQIQPPPVQKVQPAPTGQPAPGSILSQPLKLETPPEPATPLKLETPPEPHTSPEPLVQPTPAPATPPADPPPAIPTWLACIYLLLATAIGMGSIGLIVFRSNPSISWLAQ